MKRKIRLATMTAALALVVTGGVAAAAPAQAADWKAYSVSVQGQSACKGMLTSAIRGKLMTGYKVDLRQPCYHSGGGYWSAYFYYSR
ncbi:hypothetical protein [Agromyces sp. NPDC060279]|uniref:hypothetical protein n=1 Tax=Agromyces sp. NPDC060279 TaxID=3347092 RepID=UPI003652493C